MMSSCVHLHRFPQRAGGRRGPLHCSHSFLELLGTSSTADLKSFRGGISAELSTCVHRCTYACTHTGLPWSYITNGLLCQDRHQHHFAFYHGAAAPSTVKEDWGERIRGLQWVAEGKWSLGCISVYRSPWYLTRSERDFLFKKLKFYFSTEETS